MGSINSEVFSGVSSLRILVGEVATLNGFVEESVCAPVLFLVCRRFMSALGVCLGVFCDMFCTVP